MAEKLALLIANDLNFNKLQRAKVSYGLEIILGGLVKVLVFITVPMILGIFNTTIAALLASGLFRLPAGGAHCTSYGRCLLGSLVTFCILGALALYLADFVNYISALYLCWGVILLSAVVTLHYVPVDCKAKPVKPAQRLRQRVWALGTLLVYILITLIIQLPPELLLAAGMGLTVQVLTLLPQGHTLMERMDNLLGLIPGLKK